jgi:glycosyltransferase involved in cell wall biosynthesis
MRIAQVAPLVESVPPRLYGGTERVIASLVSELTTLGHDVTLYASGDSTVDAHLVPIVDQAIWRQGVSCDETVYHTVELSRVIREAPEYDIIHSHLDFLALPYGRFSSTPFVHTLHGRLDQLELQALYDEFDDAPLISISNDQRRPLPRATWLATVYNGIPVHDVPIGTGTGGYLAFVGRVSREKGLATAIDVALRAGIPLKIAARMPLGNLENDWVRADWAYYQDHVKPLLGHPRLSAW